MNDPTIPQTSAALELTVDGRTVQVTDETASLLDVLRAEGCVSVKDGCSPQGQCGCCTVLVDGAPRVACVTPVRRMKGRAIVTADGLDVDTRDRWTDAFLATGASQCGFCTPGIICRLEGVATKGGDLTDRAVVDKALLAHVCRCTGWQTIREAAAVAVELTSTVEDRDLDAAARRAELEGGASQRVAADVALGRGGFSVDSAPADALVAVPDGDGWAVGETVAAARAAAGKVQGRRTTVQPTPPVDLPAGDWAVSLQTNWVDPAYLETDVAWCEPGGTPVGPLANGGAFAPKTAAWLGDVARGLADDHGRAVKVVLDREDVVRSSPKRPPVAIGVDEAGAVTLRVAATDGVDELAAALGVDTVETVEVLGPPTSCEVRGALAVELAIVGSEVVDGRVRVEHGGAAAEASVTDETVTVRVDAGRPLDEVVLRSYVIGAVHHGLGLVRSESLAVDADGAVHDLTIRSFGVLRSIDMPHVEVVVEPSEEPAVACGVAVMSAVAAAAWHHAGRPSILPVTDR